MSLFGNASKAIDYARRYVAGDKFARHQVNNRFYPGIFHAFSMVVPTYSKQAKNLFVDLGANVGGGFDYFKRIYRPADFTFHFFEPNPHCVTQLADHLRGQEFPRGFEIYPKAAWIRNETLKFFGVAETHNLISQGGSVVSRHNSVYYDAEETSAFEVEAMDIGTYLEQVQREYDNLIVKMDIEGAELEVLEHLWARPGLFQKPTTIFAEFHSIYLKGEAERVAAQREEALRKSVPPNVKLLRWY